MLDDSKRKFISTCLGGLAILAVTGGAVVTSSIFRYYLIPRPTTDNKGKITIPVKDLAAGAAKFFEYNGYAAVLVKKMDGRLAVLSAVCTHLGCIVQWDAKRQEFICPCHAGYFTPDGEVISGPPPSPLDRLPFNVANGIVTIG
ncbi:MAG TPA: Rieske 2Fe-2S domain-containing protein [Deltaproteobacteria bacterium]|nr:Rieske 2Fe-2S domain-containing protein [Deltaproteobacteria bacterium]